MVYTKGTDGEREPVGKFFLHTLTVTDVNFTGDYFTTGCDFVNTIVGAVPTEGKSAVQVVKNSNDGTEGTLLGAIYAKLGTVSGTVGDVSDVAFTFLSKM